MKNLWIEEIIESTKEKQTRLLLTLHYGLVSANKYCMYIYLHNKAYV